MNTFKIIFSIFSFLMTLSVSSASEPLPTHWEIDGHVYFAPRPTTTAQLLIFKESESSWAYLQVSSDYRQDLSQQTAILENTYPGREVTWLRPDPRGNAKLTIPSLNLTRETDWLPRSAGPAANFSVLLSKSQAEILQLNPGKIEVTGQLTTHLKNSRVIEEVMLPAEICGSFIKEPMDLGSVLIQFATLSHKLDRHPTRFPETRASLKRSVLKECIELGDIQGTHSFSQLLGTRVFRKEIQRAPRGQTRRESEEIKEFEFTSSLPMTLEVLGR
jgi:hypothetical protein